MSVSIVNITTSKQAEKLAEIGAQFKRIRENKDLSIPNLTASTLISERYLRAIENGEIDSLPEPIYVRGFIKKYGTALGVGDISEEFPIESPLPEQKWAGSAAAELRPFHLYALYVGVIAGAVSLLATFLSAPDTNKSNDNQTIFSDSAQISTPKVSKSATPIDSLLPRAGGLEILKQPVAEASTLGSVSKNTVALPTPALTNVPTLQTKPNKSQTETNIAVVNPNLSSSLNTWMSNTNGQNSANQNSSNQNNSAIASNGNFEFVGNKPVNVGIIMKGQSWLRITVDGQTEFEGVLDEGKKLVWSGDRQISIRAGNASSVALSYNNQSIKLLGKDGEVSEKLFGVNQPNNPDANDSGLRGFAEFMSSSDTP